MFTRIVAGSGVSGVLAAARAGGIAAKTRTIKNVRASQIFTISSRTPPA